MSELPRLHQTTRSGRMIQLPCRIWNTVFFCLEYPDGIYIDKKGIPRPDTIHDVPSDSVDIADDLNILSKQERREQRNLREDLKCKSENGAYYNDKDYVDGICLMNELDADDTTGSDESESDIDDDTDDVTDEDKGNSFDPEPMRKRQRLSIAT